MALIPVAANPISVAITIAGVGGAEVTTTDVTKIKILDGVDLVEDFTSDDQRPFYYQGNLKEGFSFESGDLNLYAAVGKSGAHITTGTVKIGGARASDGVKLIAGTAVQRVVTNGVVVRGELDASPGGAPKRVTYVVTAAHSQEGAVGTVTDTTTMS